MEKQLNFVPNLSLEEMSLRRVVINMWNETDILTFFLFENFRFESLRHSDYEAERQAIFEREVQASEKWRETTETVRDKVAKLVLPISLKKRMLHIVKAIGSEMLRWNISLHGASASDAREYLDINILKQLCWTSAGLVDYKNTAEKIVRLATLDIVKRFKLACTYFLVNHIPVFWEELPQDYKRLFHSEDVIFCNRVTSQEVYWSRVLMKLDSSIPDSVNQQEFHYSARIGNKAATEYYFQKITDEGRGPYLFSTVYFILLDRCTLYTDVESHSDFPKENLSVVVCYLLSHMTPEQQMEIFKELPYHVLRCFLDWPWQDLFLEIADLIWPLIPESSCRSLLSDIAANIKSSGYYFPKLFQNVFLRSPSIIPYFVRHECHSGSFFPEFFFAEDTETITLVYRSLDIKGTGRFLISYTFFKILNGLITRDKCDMVKLCLRETSRSISREALKSKFMEYLTKICMGPMELEYRENKWIELFDSLDENNVITPREGRDTD